MVVWHLKTPLNEKEIKKLRVGDIVYLSGTIITARDEAHQRILEYIEEKKTLPVNLYGGVIYHCGPVVRKVEDNKWEVIAAGPTTSMRMELFEADVIKKTGVKMIIGKGGMGDKTANACRKYGAVYVTFTGGAAVLAAEAIKCVVDVWWFDLGIPEALWVFEVEDFGPLIVTIDSTGRDYIKEVIDEAKKRRDMILKKLWGSENGGQ